MLSGMIAQILPHLIESEMKTVGLRFWVFKQFRVALKIVSFQTVSSSFEARDH
jgi:hypothetical protein